MTAGGRRYSGSYALPAAAGVPAVRLPRVNYWSIWNEPNQPGWLAPQCMIRVAPRFTTQGAHIEWRPPGGSYRPVTTVITNDPGGFLTSARQRPGSERSQSTNSAQVAPTR